MAKNFLTSKEWKQLRADILERDGHKCCLCGSVQGLNVHHMLPQKFYKRFQLDCDNLITVCSKCHFSIHKSAGNFILLQWLRYNRPL